MFGGIGFRVYAFRVEGLGFWQGVRAFSRVLGLCRA